METVAPVHRVHDRRSPDLMDLFNTSPQLSPRQLLAESVASSRPPSRSAAHMRPKVAKLVSSPPPGTYEGPLTVRIHCETPHVELRLTRDGTTPYANSERDHGYRCEKYDPATGLYIAGKGRHVITFVACAPGHVDGRPVTLTYRLTGGPEHRKSRAEVLREAAMNRQFELTAAFENSMPFELARSTGKKKGRQHTPDPDAPTRLALADTSTLRTLDDLRQDGSRVELFRITSAVGRENAYRRVVPPSLSLTVPRDPSRKRPSSPTPSLRTNPDAGTVALSRHPSRLGERPPSGAVGSSRAVTPWTPSRATTPAAGTRPHSRQSASGSPSRPASQMSSRLLVRKTGSYSSTQQQLSWFESRSQLSAGNPEDDKEDVEEEVRYREAAAQRVEAEVSRVGRVSDKFEKAYTAVNPIAADIASDSRRFLALILHATAARKSSLRRLLSQVPYKDIARAVDRRASVTPVELVAVPGVTVTQSTLAAALREIGGAQGEQDSKTSIAVPTLLLLLRFIVWSARAMPEAILALTAQFKSELSVPSEKVVTRIEAVAVIEAYRRTRGAHPLAVAQLQDAVHSGIKWSDSDEIDLEVWVATTTAIPLVDAAIAEMAVAKHRMYEEPLPTV